MFVHHATHITVGGLTCRHFVGASTGTAQSLNRLVPWDITACLYALSSTPWLEPFVRCTRNPTVLIPPVMEPMAKLLVVAHSPFTWHPPPCPPPLLRWSYARSCARCGHTWDGRSHAITRWRSWRMWRGVKTGTRGPFRWAWDPSSRSILARQSPYRL